MENTQPSAEWAFRSRKRLRKGMSSEKGALCHVFPNEILELHFSSKVYRWLQVANDHKTVAEVALSN